MAKQLNKSETEKLKVLAMLDAEDAEILKDGPSGSKSLDFDKLFSDSVKQQDFKVGDVVTGSVVEVQSDYVLVDINYKSEGLIDINEFHRLR